MIDASNIVIRNSGRYLNKYYIDYIGFYKIEDLSKELKIKSDKLVEIYLANDGVYEKDFDVYYFDSVQNAKRAVIQIEETIKESQKVRCVNLTEKEIEYIRKALINDGMGNIGIDNKLKNSIFKKLNQ